MTQENHCASLAASTISADGKPAEEDDNEIARLILREQLTSYDIQIKEAAGSTETLALLEADSRFDIAILDFTMPKMNGMVLARKLKENPATKNIALIMSTSTSDHSDRQQAEELGVAGYLTKPLAHWHLSNTLSLIAAARKSGHAIPMVTRHNLREAKAEKTYAINEIPQFSDVNILLVEDNEVNQMVARNMLRKYGYSITVVSDGEEAIKLFRKNDFDLIFMDCQMPVMDGYEATAIIRKLEAEQNKPRTPIVAITAHALSGDESKCLTAGMDDYITKPIRTTILEHIL